MEPVSISETQVNINQTMKYIVPEDSHLHSYCHENLKPYLPVLILLLALPSVHCPFDWIFCIWHSQQLCISVLLLASDSYVLLFRLNSCPSRYSHVNCSGNGVCIDGVCTCDASYMGDACDVPVCPNNCSNSHGVCNHEMHRCDCEEGHKGACFPYHHYNDAVRLIYL